MKLRYRYNKLSLWNKLGAWGAVCSIAGVLLTVLLYCIDNSSNSEEKYIGNAGNIESPVLFVPENETWPAGITIYNGEKSVGLGYWNIAFAIDNAGFHYKTRRAKKPSSILWEAIDGWKTTRQGISFYYYGNVIDQQEEKKSSRYHFGLKLPYGKIQSYTIDAFRRFAAIKENKNLSSLEQDSFSGEIIFRNGRMVNYTWLKWGQVKMGSGQNGVRSTIDPWKIKC